MAEQPISIHYQQMEEWLKDRHAVFSRKHKKQYAELLSLAPQLVQKAQYDIPALEKQIRKNETAIEECHRVGEEAARTQQKLSDKRAAMLAEYGIEGCAGETDGVLAAVNVRVEVACRALAAAFQHYAATHLGSFKEGYNALLARTAPGAYGADAFALHFPWLQRALEEAQLALPDSAGGAADDSGGGDAGPQIDWGDDDDDVFASDAPEAAVQINWDATEMDARPADGELSELPVADGKHFSVDLAAAKHRVHVLAELQAVACFCRERSSVRPMEAGAATEELYDLLATSREAEFARMRENYRSKDALIDRIDRFEQQMLLARNRHATHQAKMHDAEAELTQLKPQYAELLRSTTATRDAAVRCLSEMFPDRKILIVGDINKYIS